MTPGGFTFIELRRKLGPFISYISNVVSESREGLAVAAHIVAVRDSRK